MDYSAIFPCTILFFLIYMSMVVAIEVWCHYIHSVCVWWWWLSVGKSSFSKCSSADVGVEKERVWKSVSSWINQIISRLITTLPLNGMRGVQRQGPWGLFMRSRQSCLFAFAAMEPCFSARAADALSWCVEHTLSLCLAITLLSVHIFIPRHGRGL